MFPCKKKKITKQNIKLQYFNQSNFFNRAQFDNHTMN